jgi:hypothetical protein
MSTSLAVSQRHLALPDSCLFAPTELSISEACSQNDFIRIVRAVARLDQANDLWKADAALHSIRHWGKEEGLAITAEASGLSKFFLYKASFVAAAFPPEHRYQTYKFSHYRTMLPFPRAWAYKFLAENADKNLSAKGLRALAVKEFGSEPHKNKQPKKQSVSIRRELFDRLRPYSDSRKVHALIEHILEEWLLKNPVPPEKKPKAEKIIEPLDMASQLARFKKSHPEYGNDSVGTSRTAGNEPDATQPRPSYAERREQQIVNGAQPIPAKPMKKRPALKLQWLECRPAEYIDSENGPEIVRPGNMLTNFRREKPDRFFTEDAARQAEEKHFQECGFHELVIRCEPCKCWHVKHVYSNEVKRAQ